MTDPGRPLSDDEARAWAAMADELAGVDVGALNETQVRAAVDHMLARYHPDDPWAPKVADALWDLWRARRGPRLVSMWEQAKANHQPPVEGTGEL